MDDHSRQLLAEISDLWNRTERRAKAVEQFRGEAIVACINEMRYAGRRIVDVLANQNALTPVADFNVSETLAIAKNYLINADHDLTDAVIFYAHKRILRVIEQHGLKKVERLCPAFEGLYPAIQEAHAIVTQSRDDRASRRSEYERLALEYTPRIIELHKALGDIAALRVRDDAALAQVGFWVRINTIVAVVGSVASIVSFGLALWGLWLAFHPPI